MTVLVVADERDPTVDAVVDDLLGRGVPVFRCDTGWFPTRLGLDARLEGSCWQGWLRTGHRSVSLDEVRSVWYRKPTAFQLPPGLSAAERRYVVWEAKFGFGGVLADIGAAWMNHPHREADLSYKPRQLTQAAASGLSVPATLITNWPDALTEFADAHDGDVIIKPLAYNSITEADGVTRALRTHALLPHDLDDLDGVTATAHLVQKRVPKDHEVRVTMVGREAFAASIHTHSDAAAVDWRSDLANVVLRRTMVPDGVLGAARRFMDANAVTFGAFDFAVTPDGEWVMFECNGAGQFGFVETATGLPITAAISAWLAKGDL